MSQPKSKLRTKTGCLSCRKRRVKCDEERPNCRKCLTSQRTCVWPTQDDLVDRRWTSRSEKRILSSSGKLPSTKPLDEDEIAGAHSGSQSLCMQWLHKPSSRLGTWFEGLEAGFLNYFQDFLFPSCFLPGVCNDFSAECCQQYLNMASRNNACKRAIIACCASNRSVLTNDQRVALFGFKYYAKAVSEVTHTLRELEIRHEVPDECLLVTVVFLYLYELWGPGPANHAISHVSGAMKIFILRYHGLATYRGRNDAAPYETFPTLLSSMRTPINQLIAESILYQSIFLTMRNPFAPNFTIDSGFLTWLESALQPLWDEKTSSTQPSVVLRIPFALYHLILDTIYLYNTAESDNAELVRLQKEMRPWEDRATDYQAEAVSSPTDTDDLMVVLYILTASILLSWFASISENTSKRPVASVQMDPVHASKGRVVPLRQVSQALSLLRRLLMDDTCSLSYLASWPLLILGYAAESDDDIDTIQKTLTNMWERTGYGEVRRISLELRQLWIKRQSVHTLKL